MTTWRTRLAAKRGCVSALRKAGLKQWEVTRAMREARAETTKPIPEPDALQPSWGAAADALETEAPATPAEFAQHAQKHALEALRVLAESMTTAGSETVRVSAANAVLDRAYGKPLPGAKAADERPSGPIEVRWVDPDFP